ncbi:MAG: hypothetical protein IJX53_07455 [Clostridia bacterium]|nr:hypothetical protein [Clostridia bacterium]
MHIPYTHESIRLTGRWDVRDPHAAVSTTTGAYIEFAFEGRMAVARFDTFANAEPRLHLWIELDGGARIEAPIDSYLRVIAPTDGYHICRIIYKGGTEQDRRWYAPLTGKVSFVGVQTDKPAALPADERPIIEYVGDSITEGVLIDMDYPAPGDVNTYIDQHLRVYQDDACATYAWLTAEALNLRPIIMGYGAVGATRAGQGRVPAAGIAYSQNFDGSPITHGGKVDYVVVNHGANDRSKPAEVYLEKYAELLDIIRAHQPQATIIALSAFCGAFHRELGEMIAAYNAKNGCTVHYINSNGWISPEPLHPYRDGHRTVAEHLTAEMKKIMQ